MEFTKNISQYPDILSHAYDSQNNFLLTIYYVFLGFYCIINGKNIGEFNDIRIPECSQEINNLCKLIEVSLIIYYPNGEQKFVAGMELKMFMESEGDFGIVIEESKTIVQSRVVEDLEALFSCISLPIQQNERKSLQDWLEKYQQSGAELTPSMKLLKKNIDSWKCKHDRIEFTTDCKQSHCVYCLFNGIKDEIPEKSLCPCNKKISLPNFQKIIQKVEPLYDIKYNCNECKSIFSINSSFKCTIDHNICIKCRSKNINNCILCQRLYNDEEKKSIEDYQIENLNSIDKCISCRKIMDEFKSQCPEKCIICTPCYNNLEICKGCKKPTGIESKLNIRCISCREFVEVNEEWEAYNCNHPVHLSCRKKKPNCNCENKRIGIYN